MKKIIIIISLLFCFGCETTYEKTKIIPYQINMDDFVIVILDSCEYIVYDRIVGHAGVGGICHKQNCKFCLDRNKK
jgi:hypothetical protein